MWTEVRFQMYSYARCGGRGGEEGGYNLKGAGVLVVSLRGINCGFQVSLGVFTTEYRYFYAPKYLLGLHSKKMKIRRRTVLMVLNRSGMKSFTFTVCEPITIIFKSNKNLKIIVLKLKNTKDVITEIWMITIRED